MKILEPRHEISTSQKAIGYWADKPRYKILRYWHARYWPAQYSGYWNSIFKKIYDIQCVKIVSKLPRQAPETKDKFFLYSHFIGVFSNSRLLYKMELFNKSWQLSPTVSLAAIVVFEWTWFIVRLLPVTNVYCRQSPLHVSCSKKFHNLRQIETVSHVQVRNHSKYYQHANNKM